MNLITFLVGLAIISTPFGAMYWEPSLGYYASTPANLFCTFASLLGFLKILLHLNPSINRRIEVSALKLWSFGFVTSLISLVFFGYNQLYIYKILSLSLLYFTWFSPLICYSAINVSMLKIPLLTSIFIMFVGFILVDVAQLNLGLIQIFISPDFLNKSNDGVVGFMQEPSHFTTALGLLIFSFYLVSRSSHNITNRSFYFFIIFLSIVMISLDSKGAAFSLALSLVLSQKLKIKNLIYFLIITPIVYLAISTKLPEIMADIEMFSSVATRTTLFVLGLFGGIINPLGWGYYGYYGVFQEFGPFIYSLTISKSFILDEFIETITYLISVSTKSSFLDLFILYGWGFIYFIHHFILLEIYFF